MTGHPLLFVYGTLRRGFPLHALLGERHVRYLGRGVIAGKLYDLGEYPGAVAPTQGGEAADSEVRGEVYELLDPARQLADLDQEEGYDPAAPDESLFVRRLTDVRLETGEGTKAWTYFLPARPSRARVIASGDYSATSRARQ